MPVSIATNPEQRRQGRIRAVGGGLGENGERLPQLQQRWQQRGRRPLAASVQFAKEQFEQIWIADSLTLEALFRKLNSLHDKPTGTLAGKMATVVYLVTRLPVRVLVLAPTHSHIQYDKISDYISDYF